METAAFDEISKLEAFVKWLDNELSKLVDERAVLKHFPQWPEKKADALREAAFSFRDLKTLETEVLLFKDEPKQLFTQSLRKAQTLLDRSITFHVTYTCFIFEIKCHLYYYYSMQVRTK